MNYLNQNSEPSDIRKGGKKTCGVAGCSDCSPVKGQATDQVTKLKGGGGGTAPALPPWLRPC